MMAQAFIVGGVPQAGRRAVRASAPQARMPLARAARPMPVISTRRHSCVARAQKAEADPSESIDTRIIEYCDINKGANKKTKGELESEFLEALRSFYYDGKPSMSNEEFDNLKDELMWEGSMLVTLRCALAAPALQGRAGAPPPPASHGLLRLQGTGVEVGHPPGGMGA